MSTLKSSAENLTLNADGSGNDIKFQSNGVEKASIDQDGNVIAAGTISSTGDTTITSGDIVFATAGKGICLGVTSNTDANTLDDYEEGTFTPVASNLSAATGSYTKIGNKVHCKAYMAASGATGIDFTGMPFTASGAAGYGAGGGIVTYQSRNSTEAWQVHANVIPVGYAMYLGAGSKQLQNTEVAYVSFTYTAA